MPTRLITSLIEDLRSRATRRSRHREILVAAADELERLSAENEALVDLSQAGMALRRRMDGSRSMMRGNVDVCAGWDSALRELPGGLILDVTDGLGKNFRT